jgi:hypothetical protein
VVDDLGVVLALLHQLPLLNPPLRWLLLLLLQLDQSGVEAVSSALEGLENKSTIYYPPAIYKNQPTFAGSAKMVSRAGWMMSATTRPFLQ